MSGGLRGPTSAGWVAVGAGVAGSATYVLLVVVARALGPEAYGRFSLFWAAIVIASLGAFLPFEQVIARRSAARGGAARTGELLGVAIRVAWVVVVLAVLVEAVVHAVLGRGQTAAQWAVTVGAFAVACVGFAWQFPARGVLAGRRALRDYAVVIVVDAGLRAAVACALAVAGVRSVTPYIAAVALSSLVCGVVGLRLARTGLGRAARTSELAADTGEQEAVDAAAVGTSTGSIPVQVQVVPPEQVPGPLRGALLREVGAVVVAMLCMQALLNSGVVVAGAAGSGQDAVVAGHLLATLTLARLPVFVLQAAQAAYVARVAAMAHRGERTALRRLLLLIGGAVAVVAALTVVVGAIAGPALVRLVFGPDYDVTTGAAALVAGGIGAYLVASVANDLTVALGGHRWTAPAWVLGLVGGVAAAVAVPDLVVRSTLPLLVGALLAALVLVPVVVSRARSASPTW